MTSQKQARGQGPLACIQENEIRGSLSYWASSAIVAAIEAPSEMILHRLYDSDLVKAVIDPIDTIQIC